MKATPHLSSIRTQQSSQGFATPPVSQGAVKSPKPVADTAGNASWTRFADPVQRAEVQETQKAAEGVIGRKLSWAEAQSVHAAHLAGIGDNGKDPSKPAGVGNYQTSHIREKTKLLQGLSTAERRALMQAGVVGLSPKDAAHAAITTDLYNGKVVHAQKFSANDNRNPLYLVRVRNDATGREREAFFKPRPYGDGEGWNRSPIEYVAYELNRMLGMDHVPPVAYRRKIDVDFQQFAEGALLFKVPDAHLLKKVPEEKWGVNKDALLSDTKILDVLIQNSDRHHGNFLRGQHWADGSYRPALIDQAAGFRSGADVKLTDDNAFLTGKVRVVRKSTYDALKALSYDSLKSKVGEFLSHGEIKAVLSRRDGVVSYFDKRIEKHGYDKVVVQS